MAKYVIIIISMVLVNNYPLAQFLGICPFLGVSKDMDSARGMGIAVTFVMVLATAVTWPIQQFLDSKGIGFTFTLVIMGSIRELIGAGTWCGIPVLSRIMPGMSIMTLVPGGFFVYAIVMAFVHYITEDKSKIKDSFGCDGCANADDCIDGSGCAKEEVA